MITNTRPRIAVLDDWQRVAATATDWSALAARTDLVFFDAPLGDVDAAAAALESFDILVAMRERLPLPAALINRLPRLRMVALTGVFSGTLDFDACTRRGIPVCNTGSENTDATTSEMALALLLAAARQLPVADGGMRAGRFQDGVLPGLLLEGRTLGIVGLGRIGARVARLGHALGMHVIAWSQNLRPDVAADMGVAAVDKATLFATADAVSLHLKLSERTRHVVGAAELAAMKSESILVNTARGGLIDQTALVAELQSGRLRAGLDVYAQEPLEVPHPLRSLPNVVLSPHLGYCTHEVYAQFYRESVANVLAYLDGTPIRVMNPEAFARRP